MFQLQIMDYFCFDRQQLFTFMALCSTALDDIRLNLNETMTVMYIEFFSLLQMDAHHNVIILTFMQSDSYFPAWNKK